MKGIKNRVQILSLAIFSFLAFTGDRTLYLILNDYIKLPGGFFRVLIIFSLFIFFINSDKKRSGTSELYLLCFSVFYFFRLVIEIILNKPYHIEPHLVFVNYILGTIIPFLIIGRVRFFNFHYRIIYKTFIYGGLLFGILIYINYGQYIGEVTRVSSMSTGDDEIIGPLDMAYIASMVIGVVLFHFYGNRVNLKKIILSFIVIGVNTIPFFLGASRGAILSIIFPFFIIGLSKPGIKSSIKTILSVILLLYLGVMLTGYLGEGLLERVNNLESSANNGNTNSRIWIWRQALSQFTQNPIMGDGLQTKGILMYPHNLFIETLLTTGILGFIPMFLLVYHAFRKSIMIIRRRKEYTWLVALFLICFIQSMFSFAIYSNKWFWLAMALLFSIDTKIKSFSSANSFKSMTSQIHKNKEIK